MVNILKKSACRNCKQRINKEYKKMRRKIMSYNLGNVIRKEYEQHNEQPDDIGTKPVPRWLQNKNARNEIEQLLFIDDIDKTVKDENKKLIGQLFTTKETE
jgi:hypothetical protein